MRKLDMARDNRWTEPWPIFAFLIRHSTGNYLVDTGDTWRNSVPGYLPKLIRDNVKVLVAPHEEIGERLKSMGLDPDKDIKSVIMSHLHHDHAGGLHHFPHSRILVSAENYKEATSLIGSKVGYLPNQWPVWFKPELFDYQHISVGPFAKSLSITDDGAITIVPTPGHAPGHASIIVKGSDGITYFIGADVSCSERNIRDNVADGVTWQPELSLQTLAKVRQFASQQPTIILCSHDPINWERMEKGQVFAKFQ
ncbi:hypothetical protein PFICI_03303 [Pestalotiopsis fici W106-1]|uniref:Metallo-beta-lactamase domain-containing protein n=1 Tax=Pestalotiopsis fici (strain W106-1 / CGMCC3.15140) TaxID=1229662 RepID=W3XGS5_PESFW|nr:uncharacterized protein PFICI_03303 [Pestalotiopsis fici W106-1]ETS85278.1 hypothetical protein PFICI_03303 [Pestalotiopsis fici W106-1]